MKQHRRTGSVSDGRSNASSPVANAPGSPIIIPVLDVMHGQVVHAVGGRRDEYQPIRSTIVEGCDPVPVAQALLRVTGSNIIYVADLDAIRGGGPISKSVRDMFHEVNATIWLDHGLRTTADRQELPEHVKLVAGTETVQDWNELKSILSSSQDVIVSLDLLPATKMEPAMADRLLSSGVQTLIVLDLASVGGSLEKLPVDYRSLKSSYPNVTLIHGGGVRDRDDCARLAGVDGVLSATAIHAGRLP